MAETMPETRDMGPILRAGDFAPLARCAQPCPWECGASGPQFRKIRPGGLPTLVSQFNRHSHCDGCFQS